MVFMAIISVRFSLPPTAPYAPSLASLPPTQVYKGKLKTGEIVAVKVQRPYVLETVTVDLYIIRTVGVYMRRAFPDIAKRADIVALLDEWAAR